MTMQIYQYEVAIPEDYSKFVLDRITNSMKIAFDSEKYKKAMKTEVSDDPDSLCMLIDKVTKNRFILLDTCPPNFIFRLVVRCKSGEQDFVKANVLETINEVKKAYGHELLSDLANTFENPDNGFNRAVRRCKVDLI